MVEHLNKRQVEDYCQQQLDVAELLPVSDHIDQCEACRERIESAMNGDMAFFALRAELFGEAAEVASPHLARAHLSAEQTAGYVDKNLSGEELQMVGDHLTNCEQCVMAVDDLRDFRDQIAPLLEREYHPATTPSVTEPAPSLPVISPGAETAVRGRRVAKRGRTGIASALKSKP